MKFVLLAFLAYLLGSIPTGLIISRSRGIDLKKTGSGNIGATNVLRTTGKWPALFTLTGDILKGVLAVTAAQYFFPENPVYVGLIGICSIIGHNFSLFLKFSGGKGVATSIGVLGIYSPQTCVFTIIIWLMTVLITKYSSLGALASFALLPFSILFFDSKEKLPIACLIMILLFVRHRANIYRLMKGSEPKIGKLT